MSRPCDCRRARTGPHTPDQCWRCWLALNTAEYGPAWGGRMPDAPQPIPGAGPPRARAEDAPPCEYLGDELSGPERVRLALPHAARWSWCLNPDAPLGAAVCPCRGCGPACRGYSPDTPD